jgi:hypothetical protein
MRNVDSRRETMRRLGFAILGLMLLVLTPRFAGATSPAQATDVECGPAAESTIAHQPVSAEPAVSAADAALVTGFVGGYAETVSEVALAVEANGRVHVLWTGKLNPNFEDYVFYSTSADGTNWTPYQVLSRWYSARPRIAVDDARRRAHLVYTNAYDGLIHRTATNGVPADPVVVAPYQPYYLPDLSLPSGGLNWPDIAVAEKSGHAYLVWLEGYYYPIRSENRYPYRFKTWHAVWDGSEWSPRLRVINDEDTFYSSIESSPDGEVMLAWFQRWEQSAGDAVSPGESIGPRTAYGTAPGTYSLRQAPNDPYTVPERDDALLLAYAAGDDAYVLVTDHFLWPGVSSVYRYLWENGMWSGPLAVAEDFSNWATPYHVGAAKSRSLIRYVYHQAGLKTRTEVNGVLGAPQLVSDILTARGVTGSPQAYFTDANGDLHMVVEGERNGVPGFYYVAP